MQLRTEAQGKRKADGQPEGSYEEPRRAEEGTTLEDKMPEDSQEARKAVGLKAPTMPSEAERKLHELTHTYPTGTGANIVWQAKERRTTTRH